MPDKIIKKNAETRGRNPISPDGVKRNVIFRLSPELINKLEIASQRRGDKIKIVEEALHQYFNSYNGEQNDNSVKNN
jgi:hypothetical protein